MSASVKIRRPHDDYGEIEYGGLTGKLRRIRYHLVQQCLSTHPARSI